MRPHKTQLKFVLNNIHVVNLNLDFLRVSQGAHNGSKRDFYLISECASTPWYFEHGPGMISCIKDGGLAYPHAVPYPAHDQLGMRLVPKLYMYILYHIGLLIFRASLQHLL